LRRIRIARVDDALRQAVEGKQQPLSAPVRGPVRADRIGDRAHPRRIAVVIGHQVRRHVPRAAHDGFHGLGGGRRILRIQRNHDDAADAVAAQRGEDLGDGRIAVAHRVDDAHAGHALLHGDGQALRMHRERRTARHPDPRVLARDALAAQRQDHAVQQRRPQPARQRDDQRVHQELGEVTTHGRCGRGVGRAEVDEHEGLVGLRFVRARVGHAQ